MGKILTGLVLVFSIASVASDFNTKGELNCSSAFGSYSNVEKFTITSGLENSDSRDLVIHSWNDYEGAVFEDSCTQTLESINCEWSGSIRNYEVL